MSNHELELFINQRPVAANFKKNERKAVSAKPNHYSAFGTSCRKVSKFDVADPLNCSLLTPGPGKYEDPDQFIFRNRYSMSNNSRLEDQYYTQKFFEDSSEKISFKRPKKEVPENLNATHPAEPVVAFKKITADRKLWEPKNYYHPYKMPEKENPGPGNYDKHYQPVKSSLTSWIFKSQSPKFEDLIPRGVGPGSYSVDYPRKLPDCENFLSTSERKTKIKLDDSVNIAPAPGVYSPYIPPNSHSSTYVFNSSSKRGCQTMPKESAGPGSYNIDIKEKHPVSFPIADRNQFQYFTGKPGVGPAHYVNTGKVNSRACSFEYYSERFFPVDKTGVFLIPEDEEDGNKAVIREKITIRKRNNLPFNSGEQRFDKNRDVWVRKKVAPDPGYYEVKAGKEKGFYGAKSPRFERIKNKVPGPGEYDLNTSPLRATNHHGFLKST